MNATARTRGEKEARGPAGAHRRTVALCGRSLLMSSVGASLRGGARLKVLPSETSPRSSVRRLREVDAVVLDLAAAPPDWTVELLKARPGLVVVGIAPGCDEVVVLSGRSRRVFTGSDLLQVIEAHLGKRAGPRRRPGRHEKQVRRGEGAPRRKQQGGERT